MIKLNLLPKNLRRRVEPGWWRLAAAAMVALVFGTVGFIHFSTATRLAALESNRDELRAQVEELRREIADQNRLNREQAQLQQILGVRNQLRERYVPWSQNLRAVFGQIPREGARPGVQIRTIGTRLLSPQDVQSNAASGAYDGKPINVEFTIQGEVLGENALIRFLEAFETNPRFGINFQQAQFDSTKGLYTFGATVGYIAEKNNNTAQGGGDGTGSR